MEEPIGKVYFLVPTDLMERLHAVLRRQPYEEVHSLIDDLRNVQLSRVPPEPK